MPTAKEINDLYGELMSANWIAIEAPEANIRPSVVSCAGAAGLSDESKHRIMTAAVNAARREALLISQELEARFYEFGIDIE